MEDKTQTIEGHAADPAPRRFVPLEVAAELFAITDLQQVRLLAKRYRAYHSVGRLERVDLPVLQAAIEAVFAAKADAAASRKARTGSKGNEIGLLIARLSKADERILAKEKKLTAAKLALKDAPDAYGRQRAHRNVEKFQTELEKLIERKKSDQARLDELLNGVGPDEHQPSPHDSDH